MPKYLFEATYTADGAKGLARDGGSARRDSIAKSLAGMGGKLESFHFAFGGVDAYVIAELPDNAAAAALALAVNQSGMATTNTVVLMTPEETDAMTKKSVSYKPPGG